MKRKYLALTMLLFVIVSAVAPFVGYEDDNKTDVAAQKETTNTTNETPMTKKVHTVASDVSIRTGISEVVFGEDLLIDNSITTKQWKEWKVQHSGWILEDNVPIMSKPSKTSEMIDKYMFNDYVSFTYYNEKWCCVKVFHPNINERGIQIGVKVLDGYVDMNYISEGANACKVYKIRDFRCFKSYMSYESIKDETSKQYELREKYAYTGEYGIRQINERFCVAVGTYFDMEIGTYFDLILENGTIIPCVLGDVKDEKHTLSDNITTAKNLCVSEFIVDEKYLPYKVKNNEETSSGNISDCCEEWNSSVVEIRVYGKNVLDNESTELFENEKI